jgi:hypothetical protein
MPITSPRPIDDLLAVANSYHEPEARDVGSAEGAHWIPAHDHLDDAEAAVEFLTRMGIRVAGRPQARHLNGLRAIRQAARALPGSHRAYHRQLGSLLADARFGLDAAGVLVPLGDGWDALHAGLLIGLVELGDHAARLKVCANDQCHWLFLDHSKNRSRQWCGAETCGNRTRVRRFRLRQETA